MFVKHALRIAGRAAGVAEPAGIALVAVVPAVVSAFAGQDIVEFIVEADIMTDRLKARLQSLNHRFERRIIEDHAVLGMTDDVAKLVVKEPRVERMQDAAHPDYS